MFQGLFVCALLFSVFSLNAAAHKSKTRYVLLTISVLFSVLALAMSRPRTGALFALEIISLAGLIGVAVVLNAAKRRDGMEA